MAPIPSGTVTFLFTDIEGSTKLAQTHSDKWETLRARHHNILQSAMDAHNGYVFQIIGDAFCVAFHTAGDAVRAAVKSQIDLHNEAWGNATIKVRMGIHTGKADVKSDGQYQGYLAMCRVQRLMSAGYGGQILVSMTTHELVRDELPEKVSLHDLGERRLKDLIRPERIYQIDIAGLSMDFPALKTLDAYRHNLPTQLTSFIGREKEMAEIKKELAGHRLVALTGSGGAGKTRLLLQVAADLLDQFPGGVWFVELAPLTNPDLLPQTILSAAGVPAQPGRTVQESLADFLREKTSLLALDNCEHLVEACAQLAETLLSVAPNLKILASSREALGVSGEMIYRVPSLSIPNLKQPVVLEHLSQYESVRLFIDRARLAQPHFALTNENAPAIAQICHRLDGIPLAIELAAVRIRLLSVEQICTRLDDRFRLLTGGSRNALPRQQTLRAAIDWSYALLSENERILLRRLAVFVGGWTLESAEQVCSDTGQGGISVGDVLDLLGHLVDKSLVTVNEDATQARYRILETVRQYAREKLLESGEGEEIRKKHFEYFHGLAAEAEPHLHYGRQQILWFDRLEDELDNFHVTLEWSMYNSPETGAELVTKLWWFWDLRGHWQEGFEWIQRALGSLSGATSVRAKLLAEAGWLASELRYVQQAIAYCTESVALYRSLGDRAGAAMPLIILGDEARERIDDMHAKEYYAESFALFKEAKDQWGLKQVMLNGSALFAQVERNFVELERIGREALAIARKLEDTEGICYSLHWLAKHAKLTADYDRARKYYAEALPLARKARYVDILTRLLRHMGVLAIRTHDYEQAKSLFEEFLQISREFGNKNRTGLALRWLGQVAQKQGNYQEALRLYMESIKVVQEMEDKKQFFSTWLELASLSGVLGQFTRSAQLFGAVETLFPIIYKSTQSLSEDTYEECQKIKTACINNLGKEGFDAAYAAGCAMSREQAIAYALEEIHE